MLERNYYYLVTSLPDIVLEHPRMVATAAAFMDDITELLDPRDAQLLRTVRLPADNTNLITLLEARHDAFAPGGNYPQEQLEQEIKKPETLPDYMQEFLQAQREGRQLYPELTTEDQLARLFYEQVIEHENEFIAAWFTFELNLRNALAALALKKKLPHLHGRRAVLCCNDVAEQMLKSASPDFGLGEKLPWIDHVVELQDHALPEREIALDRLRWEMLDELTVSAGFRIETILAFCIKLILLERWVRLDSVAGKEKLEQMVEKICEGVRRH
ncbi:MAG: DUF2764 domain-containing protein [Desulfobacterota bacterium]|nr:DUF2764 domain-containing protein [Thermodesulfobacteriota bacterium]